MKTDGLRINRSAVMGATLVALSLGMTSGNYSNDYIPANWGNQPLHKRGKFKKNQRKKKK